MAGYEFHYDWRWHFRSAPQELWPLVADTNRFDRDAGLPPVEDNGREGETLGNARRRLRFVHFGMPLEWVEEPSEWVAPHRFDVTRNYSKGPVRQLRVRVTLTAHEDGGTLLNYQVWAIPANILGYAAIPIQIGLLSARRFGQVFRDYDRLVQQGKMAADLPAQKPSFAPGGRTRLRQLEQRLLERGFSAEWVDRLGRLLSEADDLAVYQLRPYMLADAWGAPRQEVLQICLWATRLGLLDFRWDLLCPLCRVAKDNSRTLGGITRQVHCDTCNIDYTANFEQSVELTFRPNPAIRQVDDNLAFCTSGPLAMPHVAAQQLLPPGGSAALPLQLDQGRYRLRAIELPGSRLLQIQEDGETAAEITVRPDGWTGQEMHLAQEAELQLKNGTAAEQLFILERTAWSDQSVTAAEVTLLQEFRDLFAAEALRPDEQISVGNLTILFTDLRDSTRLYQEIGDAPAFGLVMSHFDLLQKAINQNQGSIVKTIGDSVMAVFRQPASGLAAVWQARELLAQGSGQQLILKAGLHHGPCIAVNLNERLDYFGSSVNIAARLESLSQGEDVIISQTVFEDPAVQSILQELEEQLLLEPQMTVLKGFDRQSFDIWRISQRP